MKKRKISNFFKRKIHPQPPLNIALNSPKKEKPSHSHPKKEKDETGAQRPFHPLDRRGGWRRAFLFKKKLEIFIFSQKILSRRFGRSFLSSVGRGGVEGWRRGSFLGWVVRVGLIFKILFSDFIKLAGWGQARLHNL